MKNGGLFDSKTKDRGEFRKIYKKCKKKEVFV